LFTGGPWFNTLYLTFKTEGEVAVVRSITKTPAGYRFTKGLTQNLNLRTHLKLEYYIKSLIYIQ